MIQVCRKCGAENNITSLISNRKQEEHNIIYSNGYPVSLCPNDPNSNDVDNRSDTADIYFREVFYDVEKERINQLNNENRNNRTDK